MSCQCDFADVDHDGDDDLLHSSYGQSFSGLVMSRLFLNDGTGFFDEYNPSGQVSANPNLAAQTRAGFVEGTQQTNTTNTTGLFHDITNVSLDVDFADFDGDFDNDIQADSRDTQQRMFQNRWFENGESYGTETAQTRLYRDVTGSWLLGPNGLAEQPGANYDNDFHDMDNDSDVDGYFLGYIGTTDKWGVNDGSGHMQNFQTVPNSANDDNEIDWHDYDHDGDVDPFISAFSGADRFYKNQYVESASINLVQVSIGTGMGGEHARLRHGRHGQRRRHRHHLRRGRWGERSVASQRHQRSRPDRPARGSDPTIGSGQSELEAAPGHVARVGQRQL